MPFQSSTEDFFYQRIEHPHQSSFGHLDIVAVGNKVEVFQPSNFRTPFTSELLPISRTKYGDQNQLLQTQTSSAFLSVATSKQDVFVRSIDNNLGAQFLVTMFCSKTARWIFFPVKLSIPRTDEKNKTSPKLRKLFLSSDETLLFLLFENSCVSVFEMKSLVSKENGKQNAIIAPVHHFQLHSHENGNDEVMSAAATDRLFAISKSSPSSTKSNADNYSFSIELYSLTAKDPQVMQVKKSMHVNSVMKENETGISDTILENLPPQLDHSHLLTVLTLQNDSSLQEHPEHDDDGNKIINCPKNEVNPPSLLFFVSDEILISLHPEADGKNCTMILWDVDRAKRDLQTSVLRSKIHVNSNNDDFDDTDCADIVVPSSMKKVTFVEQDNSTFSFLVLTFTNKVNQVQIFFDVENWREVWRWKTRNISSSFFTFPGPIHQDFEQKSLKPLKNLNVAVVSSRENVLVSSNEQVDGSNHLVSKDVVQMFLVKIITDPEHSRLVLRIELELFSTRLLEKDMLMPIEKSRDNYFVRPVFFTPDLLAVFTCSTTKKTHEVEEIFLYSFIWGRRIQISPLICKNQIKLMKLSPRGTFLYLEDVSGSSYTLNYEK